MVECGSLIRPSKRAVFTPLPFYLSTKFNRNYIIMDKKTIFRTFFKKYIIIKICIYLTSALFPTAPGDKEERFEY